MFPFFLFLFHLLYIHSFMKTGCVCVCVCVCVCSLMWVGETPLKCVGYIPSPTQVSTLQFFTLVQFTDRIIYPSITPLRQGVWLCLHTLNSLRLPNTFSPTKNTDIHIFQNYQTIVPFPCQHEHIFIHQTTINV